MPVTKRGLAVGGAALAGILVVAGVASAATKKKGGGGGNGGGTSPSGFSGDNQDECEAWLAERQIAIGNRDQLAAALVDLDAERIYQASEENWEALAVLDAQRAKIVSQKNQFEARANELAVLMQDCK